MEWTSEDADDEPDAHRDEDDGRDQRQVAGVRRGVCRRGPFDGWMRTSFNIPDDVLAEFDRVWQAEWIENRSRAVREAMLEYCRIARAPGGDDRRGGRPRRLRPRTPRGRPGTVRRPARVPGPHPRHEPHSPGGVVPGVAVLPWRGRAGPRTHLPPSRLRRRAARKGDGHPRRCGALTPRQAPARPNSLVGFQRSFFGGARTAHP